MTLINFNEPDELYMISLSYLIPLLISEPKKKNIIKVVTKLIRFIEAREEGDVLNPVKLRLRPSLCSLLRATRGLKF